MLSLIIPAYNEEAILPSTIETLTHDLCAMVDACVLDSYEIVFVSDGSKDQTPAILRAAAEKDPRIVPVIYSPNKGKGGAVREGILASKGDIVLYTDCDLAYGTAVIGDAVKELQSKGTDILIGSRAIHPEGYEGYTWSRLFASRIYLKLLSLYAGFSHSDSQCGFKAMMGDIGRSIFKEIKTMGFAFDLEFLLRAQKKGCSFTEFPVKIVNHRDSSIHLLCDSIKMIKDLRMIKKDLKEEK